MGGPDLSAADTSVWGRYTQVPTLVLLLSPHPG